MFCLPVATHGHFTSNLTNLNINIADHITLETTNLGVCKVQTDHSLDDHVVANRCKSISSEQKKAHIADHPPG
jgi:hypothetical protein